MKFQKIHENFKNNEKNDKVLENSQKNLKNY